MIILSFSISFSYAQDQNMKLIINDRIIETEDFHPFMNEKNQIFVPARSTCAYLGFTMCWKPEERTITFLFHDGSKEIKVYIDKGTAYNYQNPIILTEKPIIHNNTIFIPLDMISNYLDGHVLYKGYQHQNAEIIL